MMEYSTTIKKAENKLIQNFKNWVKQNEVKDKSDDIKQWVKDDIGEYTSGYDLSDDILKILYRLVK